MIIRDNSFLYLIYLLYHHNYKCMMILKKNKKNRVLFLCELKVKKWHIQHMHKIGIYHQSNGLKNILRSIFQ